LPGSEGVEVGVVVVIVDVDVVSVAPPPGRHCEYQLLLKTQVYPDTHVVGPDQP
jgi:hypothetical protein